MRRGPLIPPARRPWSSATGNEAAVAEASRSALDCLAAAPYAATDPDAFTIFDIDAGQGGFFDGQVEFLWGLTIPVAQHRTCARPGLAAGVEGVSGRARYVVEHDVATCTAGDRLRRPLYPILRKKPFCIWFPFAFHFWIKQQGSLQKSSFLRPPNEINSSSNYIQELVDLFQSQHPPVELTIQISCAHPSTLS